MATGSPLVRSQGQNTCHSNGDAFRHVPLGRGPPQNCSVLVASALAPFKILGRNSISPDLPIMCFKFSSKKSSVWLLLYLTCGCSFACFFMSCQYVPASVFKHNFLQAYVNKSPSSRLPSPLKWRTKMHKDTDIVTARTATPKSD